MPEEGIEPGISEADVNTLLAAHATLSTGIHGEVRKRKTEDQIVNNNTFLVDDEELFFPIGANEVWEVAVLPIQFSSDIANFQYTIVAPVGAEGFFSGVAYNSAGGLDFYKDILGGTPDLLGQQANILEEIRVIVINGSTPGHVQFQWAQNFAEESDTIVRANSCIIAHRLA